MIVYNITTQVDWDIAEAWLIWQQETFIPEVMATQLFDEYKVYQLLELDNQEGPTYTIQFFTNAMERYSTFIADHASALREKSIDRWGEQFISYHSCMQLVN